MSDDGADAFLQMLGESLEKGEFGKKPEHQAKKTDEVTVAEAQGTCQYCGTEYSMKRLRAHEKKCGENPSNAQQSQPAVPPAAAMTKEQFEDYLRTSTEFRTQLTKIKGEFSRQAMENLKKVDTTKIFGDDRIQAALQLIQRDPSQDVDWSAMVEEIKTDLLESIKKTGDVPLYYRNNDQLLPDLIRMFPYGEWETYDPQLRKWLEETTTRLKYKIKPDAALPDPDITNRKGKMRNTSATAKRYYELFHRLLMQHRQAMVEKDLKDFAKKIVDVVLEQVGKVVNGDTGSK